MRKLTALLCLMLLFIFPCFSSVEHLYRAASYGNPTDVTIAAMSAGSLYAEEDDGWNAFFYAATNNGDTEVLQLLIDNGFSVNDTDSEGRTPLMCSAEFNKESKVTA